MKVVLTAMCHAITQFSHHVSVPKKPLLIDHDIIWPYLAQKNHLHLLQFSRSVVSNSLRAHESQHTRPPCPSPTPRVYSNSCPSSQWYHPAISSSVVPFFSCPQSLLALGSFPTSQLFAWGGQNIGVSASASVLPVNTQDWSLGWTGCHVKVKSLSRVRLFVTPWTVIYRGPLSMGFSRQEYWIGLPFPSPSHVKPTAIFFSFSHYD